jgi:glycosyltransferase involved in cell wall biosynthesis
MARGGRDALLVQPGDSAALAKAINLVLTSPARRAELVASGRERARHFSMDRLADTYVAYYQEAIK